MARAILIVLDGLGVGGAPDAAAYGDAGSDTLANMAAAVGGLDVPASGGPGSRQPARHRRRGAGGQRRGPVMDAWSRFRRARTRPPGTGN